MAGFPNCYLIGGPNNGSVRTSVIHMFASQANSIAAAIGCARDHGLAAVEPTLSAQQDFTAEVDRMGQGSVWTGGGCASAVRGTTW